jgi:hypothetical protein
VKEEAEMDKANREIVSDLYGMKKDGYFETCEAYRQEYKNEFTREVQERRRRKKPAKREQGRMENFMGKS